ncbi:MAG: DinB family protein [Acidobacteriota bacterium]
MEARAVTVALMVDLDQGRLDAVPVPGRWSLGEIFDHLIRADRMFLREVHAVVERQRRGGVPFVYRGLRDMGFPGGSLPLPLRLPIEGTLVFWNVALPSRLRELAIRRRVVPARAPRDLVPTPRRAREALLADLRAGIDEARRLETVPDLDFRAPVFYSPLTGLSSIDGLIRLIALHDQRHHQQVREARKALGLGPDAPSPDPSADPVHTPAVEQPMETATS